MQDLVLGIDGGGTSCRAALATADGAVIGRGLSGPANIRIDLQGARANIVEAAQAAFEAAGLEARLGEVDAVLGLAGTNVGGFRQSLLAVLPFRRSVVESDALIALEGALGTDDGAIAILGTGSIFMGRRGGRLRTVGGWGAVLGDQGGGARLGRELLEEVLLAHDDIRPPTALTDAAMARFGGDPREVVTFADTARSADFAALAPLVFEHADRGDAAARRVLGNGLAAIEEALAALELRAGERLSLLGGLAPLYGPRLSARFGALLQPPLGDALAGAVSMALRLFRGIPDLSKAGAA